MYEKTFERKVIIIFSEKGPLKREAILFWISEESSSIILDSESVGMSSIDSNTSRISVLNPENEGDLPPIESYNLDLDIIHV